MAETQTPIPPPPVDLEARRAHERGKYLALMGTGYGSTNHGRHAYALLQSFRPPPRYVVDFGCGRNLFIQHLRRLGIDGLGVDFAFPEADVVAPMHRVPVSAGIAEVVTAFDALEHLLPEEVDEVLDEMRRVAVPGGRFVLSICTRESKTQVNGEGLHPTVKPRGWWLERIGRVGTVRQGLGAPRYIAGVFNNA